MLGMIAPDWNVWEWTQYRPLSDRFTSLAQELPQELDKEVLGNNVFFHNIHSLSDG